MINTRKNRIRMIGVAATLIFTAWPVMASGQRPLPIKNVFSPKTSSISKSGTDDKQIRRVKLSEATAAFKVGNVLLAEQIQADDFQQLRRLGIKRVVVLNPSGNTSFDEQTLCESLGIEYQQVPFDRAEQLNDSVFNAVRIALLESDETPVLIHGGSMDHVAAVWIVYRSLDQGIDLDKALREAVAIGKKTSEFDQNIRGYVTRMISIPSQSGPAVSSPTVPTAYAPYVAPAPGST